MRVLKCNTEGCYELSGFEARLHVFGSFITIKEAYHLSRRFDGQAPISVWDCEGLHGKFYGISETSFEINGIQFDRTIATAWLTYLWVSYLDSRPGLVNYLKTFDDFEDSTGDCPVDIIRTYVKQGREPLLQIYASFTQQLEHQSILV